jgi:hypothetical protein
MISKNEFYRDRFINQEQLNIILTMQRIWLELSFGLRSLLFSAVRDPERIQAAANQLYGYILRNFYEIFRQYYGLQVAQQIVNLLTDYVTDLWRIYDGQSKNDTNTIDTFTASAYQRGDLISTFLSNINVYWLKDQWKDSLDHYTQLMIAQAVAVAQKDFDTEFQIYRQIADSSVLKGDYMARGVMAQLASNPMEALRPSPPLNK